VGSPVRGDIDDLPPVIPDQGVPVRGESGVRGEDLRKGGQADGAGRGRKGPGAAESEEPRRVLVHPDPMERVGYGLRISLHVVDLAQLLIVEFVHVALAFPEDPGVHGVLLDAGRTPGEVNDVQDPEVFHAPAHAWRKRAVRQGACLESQPRPVRHHGRELAKAV
jgi:hypothetical protein